MKKNKTILILLVAIGSILIVIFAVALGYYDIQKNLNENIDIEINSPGSADLIVYGSGTVNMVANSLDMISTTDDTIAYESNQGFVLKVINNLGDTLETCTYDYVWTWDSSSDSFTSFADNELTISGPFTETKIPNYNASSLATVIGSGSVSSASISYISVPFTVIFRSLANYNQESRLNKNYSGSLSIDNISCSTGDATSYTGDQQISVSDFTEITGVSVSNPDNYENLNVTVGVVSGTGISTDPYIIGTD